MSVDWPQGQPGNGMQMLVLHVCRFLQLELSEMEAFVNQHKSKVIKRQVMNALSLFYCPIKVLTFLKLCILVCGGVYVCGGQRTLGAVPGIPSVSLDIRLLLA